LTNILINGIFKKINYKATSLIKVRCSIEMSKKSIFIVCFFSISLLGHSQVSVSYNTATNLVNNVLLGSGVTASNITSGTSNNRQLGFFESTGTSLGISSGLVLATDDVKSLDY